MSSEHWQAFLQSGALASCPTTDLGTYDQELEQGWREFFGSLPDGARALDIGTGNGPILLIAKRVAEEQGRRLELHGADRAAIDPPRFVKGPVGQYDGIVFHPCRPTERLTFTAALFDAVTGQYALEYGPARESVAEVARVLKPQGLARFVVHHESSVVVNNAREASQHALWVLNELRVYRRLEQFLHMERIKSKEVDRAFSRLEEVGQKMMQALQATPHSHVLRVTLEAVQNFLDARRRMNPSTLNYQVKAKQQALESALVRMQDLLHHACSLEHVDYLESCAREFGLEVAPRSLQHHGSNLVGWVLQWRRLA